MKMLLRLAAAAFAIVVAAVAIFAAYVFAGMKTHARYTGTISGLGVRAPVTVLRDARGVPHVVATNERDLFFAQGYVEASDRLFQMDLQRRYVEGTLAEVFGKAALHSDETERAIPVRAMVLAQWQRLDAHSRDLLEAFSDGANAAMQRETLPVEFRLLSYHPQPWRPYDTLAIGMAEVLDLIDDWNEVSNRDAAYRKGGQALLDALYPLSDPCYDAPVMGGLKGMGPGKPCAARPQLPSILARIANPVGSNEWAAGAARSSTGRALLANDPHLGLSIPGVWYLADLRAPGFHAAGATLAGVPMILLGHNDRIAWGMTDATVASLSVFEPPKTLDPNGWRTETFGVRLGGHVTQRYYSTPQAFGVTTDDGRFVLVKWRAYDRPAFAGATFYELDRAGSIEAALAALARFEGPAHNFAIADASGRVAYAMAGPIPNDPLWARRVHPPADFTRDYPPIAWNAMPRVAPSRDGVIWTANNLVYGNGYPYRLSPQFSPPYRAYRIAQLLRAQPKYDVAYFTRMQMDALSLPELELARALAPSLQWDGEMTGDSTAATAVAGLRKALTGNHKLRMPSVLADVARSRLHEALSQAEPWSASGAVPVQHKLSALGVDFLNGVTLPGYGDEYTIHVQYHGYSQSFRAVWDVGNWDAGGITIPQGESGEPGSDHYTDQAAAWIAGRLLPLPFSDSAVERTAVERETLNP